jgi:hypothetical protein
MLTADERFLFNKLFLKVKKNYLDVYGFDNKLVSNQDVVDFINAIASRPAQGTTADDVLKSIAEEDKKKTGRLRADIEGVAIPKVPPVVPIDPYADLPELGEPDVTFGTPVVPEAAAEADVQAAESIKVIARELLRQFAKENGVDIRGLTTNGQVMKAINANGLLIPEDIIRMFKNKDDKAGFSQTGWTLLRELSSPSLLSSLINKNDFVELEYGLPRSNEIIAQGATCDSTSNIITMSKTQSIGKNAYIYLKDNNSSNFNLRQVMQIVDTNNITLHLKPSFTSDNVAIGLIRFLNGPRSAFIYTENNNIIRYVDRNDTIYDGYKNFAIKIVPLSNTSYIVPRCQDMRAIALQI